MTNIRLEAKTLLGSTFAIFSECRQYRFVLGRIWDESRPLCNGLFMNPSTADHKHLDPTTERFKTRCQMLGFGGFVVTNVHAFIETKQRTIRQIADPVGSDNDRFILEAADQCAMVLCGYGANQWSRARADHVRDLLAERCPDKLHCLRLTQAGQPEHPLYISYDTVPVRWRVA